MAPGWALASGPKSAPALVLKLAPESGSGGAPRSASAEAGGAGWWRTDNVPWRHRGGGGDDSTGRGWCAVTNSVVMVVAAARRRWRPPQVDAFNKYLYICKKSHRRWLRVPSDGATSQHHHDQHQHSTGLLGPCGGQVAVDAKVTTTRPSPHCWQW